MKFEERKKKAFAFLAVLDYECKVTCEVDKKGEKFTLHRPNMMPEIRKFIDSEPVGNDRFMIEAIGYLELVLKDYNDLHTCKSNHQREQFTFHNKELIEDIDFFIKKNKLMLTKNLI